MVKGIFGRVLNFRLWDFIFDRKIWYFLWGLIYEGIFFFGGGGGIQLRRSKYFCINSPNAVQEQADFAEF